MRLARTPTASPASAGLDLDRRAAEVMDARLAPHSKAPLAVAYSGGGDSLALLLAAGAWAKAHERPLLALTVDHRLQSSSAAWTRACAAKAARLGAGFRGLAWEGAKPLTGLPAAARAARHRLLAEAARAAGARVLLIAHTADDLAEARAMRAAGSTTPEPQVWSPSPAWPEGRGLFVLRPLLGLGREEIRRWLAARGEVWIDDPANADPRFARARARAALAAGQPPSPATPSRPDLSALARAARAEPWGGLTIPREALEAAPAQARAAFLSAACLCTAGGTRPPRADRTRRLAEALAGAAPFVASLAGARIEADATQVRFIREAGEARRGGLALLPLSAGVTAVWDGRFEVTALRSGLSVRALCGLMARLEPKDRSALKAVPAAARGALPAVLEADRIACPLLAPESGVTVKALAHQRLLAACGAVTREPA